MSISVVIRNKNESEALSFLLKVLSERYSDDIEEVIVLDNLSSDESEMVSKKYGVKFVTIQKFSYGSSANIAAIEAKNDIVVIFSAHSYPVSHDFFKLIKAKFAGREHELAGLRCLHNNTDYKFYLNGFTSNDSPNLGGLIFSGSAFNKKLWEKYPFNENVCTFEDKEWTMRMIDDGYKIEFVPSIFCYFIKRNKSEMYFRFKNDTLGDYQMFGNEQNFKAIISMFFSSMAKNFTNFFISTFYDVKKTFFLVNIKIRGFKKYSLKNQQDQCKN